MELEYRYPVFRAFDTALQPVSARQGDHEVSGMSFPSGCSGVVWTTTGTGAARAVAGCAGAADGCFAVRSRDFIE